MSGAGAAALRVDDVIADEQQRVAVAASGLSAGEVAILQWSADGKRSLDIACLMGVESAAAIDIRFSKILDKTGCASRTSAIAWALRRGIIK